MKAQLFKFLVFLVTFLVSNTASPQTAVDTSSILTGTVMRGVPKVEPVKPQPINSNEAIIGYSKNTTNRPGKITSYNDKTLESVDFKDTVLLNAYRNSLIAYYQSIERKNINNITTFDSVTAYYEWALQNRQKIIDHQQITGSIIFILVVLLVLCGLLFSAIQFYIALKGANRKILLPDTSIKASLSGIEVSSSVLGVIILTLSIAFFYLYLIKVYPLVSLDQISIQSF